MERSKLIPGWYDVSAEASFLGPSAALILSITASRMSIVAVPPSLQSVMR